LTTIVDDEEDSEFDNTVDKVTTNAIKPRMKKITKTFANGNGALGRGVLFFRRGETSVGSSLYAMYEYPPPCGIEEGKKTHTRTRTQMDHRPYETW
jgi:hypothetical protein